MFGKMLRCTHHCFHLSGMRQASLTWLWRKQCCLVPLLYTPGITVFTPAGCKSAQISKIYQGLFRIIWLTRLDAKAFLVLDGMFSKSYYSFCSTRNEMYRRKVWRHAIPELPTTALICIFSRVAYTAFTWKFKQYLNCKLYVLYCASIVSFM